MAITIKDVAREAGVSPATVSLALNNSPMIGAATTRKVKETAFRMGYVRNQYARGLARGRSNSIALVVPSIENQYFASLVKSTTMDARQSDYDVSIAVSQESISDEWRIMRRMAQQRPEAILLSPVNIATPSEEYAAWLRECPVPIIFIASRYPGVEIPYVMYDVYTGMRELSSYVISSGVKSIALITSESEVEAFALRTRGFSESAALAGVSWDVWRIKEFTYKDANDLVSGKDELPDAIICASDMLAMGALNAVRARGLRVPDDVMIAGFDDSILSQIAQVPLTTVRQDIPRMVNEALGMAMEVIGGDPGVPSRLLPCSLVKRRSTER